MRCIPTEEALLNISMVIIISYVAIELCNVYVISRIYLNESILYLENDTLIYFLATT